MPLVFAPIGCETIITHFNVEGDIKRHLENLGFLPGETITPVSENAGDVIVAIRNSRLAINKNLASKIYVRIGRVNDGNNVEAVKNRRNRHCHKGNR